MSKFILLSLFISVSVLAQKQVPDIYQATGFNPPSTQEIDTLYEETYLTLKKSADCRREFMANYKYQGPQACTAADEYCGGNGIIDAKQRFIEDNFKSFFGTFTYASMASYGSDQCNSTKFNYYKGETYQGKENGMSCWLQGAPGAEFSGSVKEFEEAHHALINNQKPKKSLEKIAEKACEQFGNENTNRGHMSLVKYSAGINGANVTRTVKNVESLKEALPLLHFSVVRNYEMGHDYVGSSSGSSNQGSDAVMKELEHDLLQKYYKAYDGNRFAGFYDKKSQNPFYRMRGMNEGNGKEWNEKENPGSAGVIFWEMCVVQDGSGKKPGLEQPAAMDPKSGLQKSINLTNQNVSVELPNNVVSPFPLKVVKGKIVDVDLTFSDKSGFAVPKLNSPAYAYGPRNTELSPHEKAMMVEGATAMKNKAAGFVTKVLDNPGEVVNLEKSSIIIASCSNQLKNQPGFKEWRTDSAPEARGKSERISFEELSDQRSEAQYIILTSLIKKELEDKKRELDLERKKLIAQKVQVSENSALAVKLSNRISYFDDQITKISKMDVSKIQKSVVKCDAGGEKGVGGPTPYYSDLKDKFGAKSWPKRDGSDSAYFTQVAQLSKDLKKKDIEEKLGKTKAALSELDDSAEAKISSAVYKDWIVKYQSMLDGKDGEPGYLNIPLLNSDKFFPCDMNRPGDEITCDVVSETSKSLDGFKVEKFMADVQMDQAKVSPEVADGWKDRKPAVYEPGGAKIYHAAAICNRKYEEKEVKTKGKKCISKTTGWEVDCPSKGKHQ
jgi:hypothetical protein